MNVPSAEGASAPPRLAVPMELIAQVIDCLEATRGGQPRREEMVKALRTLIEEQRAWLRRPDPKESLPVVPNKSLPLGEHTGATVTLEADAPPMRLWRLAQQLPFLGNATPCQLFRLRLTLADRRVVLLEGLALNPPDFLRCRYALARLWQDARQKADPGDVLELDGMPGSICVLQAQDAHQAALLHWRALEAAGLGSLEQAPTCEARGQTCGTCRTFPLVCSGLCPMGLQGSPPRVGIAADTPACSWYVPDRQAHRGQPAAEAAVEPQPAPAGGPVKCGTCRSCPPHGKAWDGEVYCLNQDSGRNAVRHSTPACDQHQPREGN